MITLARRLSSRFSGKRIMDGGALFEFRKNSVALGNLQTSARQRGLPVSPPAGPTTSPFFVRRDDPVRIGFAHGGFGGAVSLAADLYDYASASWPVELAEVDPLPRPEDQAAVLDEDLFAAPDERALAVRVGVPFAVAIARV